MDRTEELVLGVIGLLGIVSFVSGVWFAFTGEHRTIDIVFRLVLGTILTGAIAIYFRWRYRRWRLKRDFLRQLE